jgi:very-short-patch-repair endonuclease
MFKVVATNPKAITAGNLFLKKANDIHDNKYNYSKFIYKNNSYKGIIKCSIHGNYPQSAGHHLSGKGCPECGLIKKNNSKRCSSEDFIKKAEKIHKKKFNYSKVEYINSGIPVVITCLKHGDFPQIPDNHLAGKGCKKCAMEILTIKNTKLVDVFIKESILIHNNYYDYSKVEYINSNTKVIIKCPIHGYFQQKPREHLNKCGCPACSKGQSSSYPEQYLFYYLSKLKLKIENRKNIDNIEVDIYIPYLKLAIEYDGEYYHRNKENRDLEKNKILYSKGINLIRIREKGLNKIRKCFNIIRKKTKDNELSEIVEKIIIFINKNYNKNYKTNFDINQNNILSSIKSKKIENSINITHPQVAQQWHPTKNGDMKPEFFTKGTHKKFWWICDNGHEWESMLNSRCSKGNHGCPYCSGVKISKEKSFGMKYNLDIIQKFWDYDNNKISPYEVGIHSDVKVWSFTLKGDSSLRTISNITRSIERYIHKIKA